MRRRIRKSPTPATSDGQTAHRLVESSSCTKIACRRDAPCPRHRAGSLSAACRKRKSPAASRTGAVPSYSRIGSLTLNRHAACPAAALVQRATAAGERGVLDPPLTRSPANPCTPGYQAPATCSRHHRTSLREAERSFLVGSNRPSEHWPAMPGARLQGRGPASRGGLAAWCLRTRFGPGHAAAARARPARRSPRMPQACACPQSRSRPPLAR